MKRADIKATLEVGRYYHVYSLSNSSEGRQYGKRVARYNTFTDGLISGSFWVAFTALENESFVLIYINGQRELEERVIPVSKTFSKYLKLTERK